MCEEIPLVNDVQGLAKNEHKNWNDKTTEHK